MNQEEDEKLITSTSVYVRHAAESFEKFLP